VLQTHPRRKAITSKEWFKVVTKLDHTWNLWRRALCTITQGGWNLQLPLLPNTHTQQTLVPTCKTSTPKMTFHLISIIFISTDNFFTYLSKEYNITSVDSKYLQQARHTQENQISMGTLQRNL
jgi:hypothetical protein